MDSMLNLYRRHEADCKYRDKGTAYLKCTCPLWCDGRHDGERIRQSLKTRDLARAKRKIAEMESELDEGREGRTVADAARAFMEDQHLAPTSKRKYEQRMKFLAEHFPAPKTVGEIELSDLDDYKKWRGLSSLTWSKELETLRTFWAFCIKRKWATGNVAKDMRTPRNVKGRERTPYTPDEIAAILAACDKAGVEPYERLRWKAMILLMRQFGLRVSDVALLKRDKVRHGRIAIRAQKNGEWVEGPLTPEIQAALDVVPLPDGKPSKWFFWTGKGNVEIHVNTVIMSLKSVYVASGVKNATSHRFRHTIATEMLAQGASVEDVAALLGDAPDTIRKHYAHFSPARRERIAELLRKVHGAPEADNSLGTPLEREKDSQAKWLKIQ
jgi:site-specific recombinase XerD